MKKTLALTIALCLMMTLMSGGFTAFAENTADVSVEPSDAESQLEFIFTQADKLKQDDSQNTWYYAVTDFDHDGNLEFVAASQHPQDRSTNLKVWEVSEDRTALTECTLSIDSEESFPDILTDSADVYHDKETDTWYYMMYDNIVISNSEVYTVKTAVNLKDGVIGYDAYAVEHTVLNKGARTVSHTDANGISISPEQYNASGTTEFASADRSSASFEWLTAEELGDQTKLSDTYSVFTGDKAPTEALRVPKPAALETEAVTTVETPTPTATPAPAAPVATPVPVAQPVYLTITKNPTNENKKTGGTAYFVACANTFDSLYWTFVSPDGGEYSPQSFVAGSNAVISGEYGTTLSVANVETWMNGWGAYCTFYYQGQTARTTTAYIYVDGNKATTPDWQTVYGSMSGTAYRDSNSTLCIFLQNGSTVYVPSYSTNGYTCNIYGEVYAAGGGSSCMVYYINYPNADNIYMVEVYGNDEDLYYEDMLDEDDWDDWDPFDTVFDDDDGYIWVSPDDSWSSGDSFGSMLFG